MTEEELSNEELLRRTIQSIRNYGTAASQSILLTRAAHAE